MLEAGAGRRSAAGRGNRLSAEAGLSPTAASLPGVPGQGTALGAATLGEPGEGRREERGVRGELVSDAEVSQRWLRFGHWVF